MSRQPDAASNGNSLTTYHWQNSDHLERADWLPFPMGMLCYPCQHRIQLKRAVVSQAVRNSIP